MGRLFLAGLVTLLVWQYHIEPALSVHGGEGRPVHAVQGKPGYQAVQCNLVSIAALQLTMIPPRT